MVVDSSELDCNDFVAIAAGSVYSLALKQDGSIVGWGYSGYGQATPLGGNDNVAIAAGGGHCLALKQDGSIVGWETTIMAKQHLQQAMIMWPSPQETITLLP